MKTRQQVQVDDLKATENNLVESISVLSSQIVKQNEIVKKNKVIIKEQEKIEEELKLSISNLSDIHREQCNDISVLKQQLSDYKDKLESEFNDIKKQISLSLKELGRVNQQVITANTELEELKSSTDNFKEKKDELDKINESIEIAKINLFNLQEEQNRYITDISTVNNDLHGKIREATSELEVLAHLAEQKKDEASQAQIRTKRYVDEMFKHMNDYQVVKSRIEVYWNKAFPELDIPL